MIYLDENLQLLDIDVVLIRHFDEELGCWIEEEYLKNNGEEFGYFRYLN